MEKLNEWKNQDESTIYDYKRVNHCFASMKTLRKQNAVKTLSHMLRQDLVKNFCSISHPDLYSKCHFGTKKLMEKYHKEEVKCIKMIAETPKLNKQQKLTFFSETRHSFGHTALMLSGGACFGKFHFGLLRVLFDSDLMPRTVCGSSIGGLVAACICTRNYEKVGEVSFINQYFSI